MTGCPHSMLCRVVSMTRAWHPPTVARQEVVGQRVGVEPVGAQVLSFNHRLRRERNFALAAPAVRPPAASAICLLTAVPFPGAMPTPEPAETRE